MTKRERQKILEAIKLIVGDDGTNDGWHRGIEILMKLAGCDTSHLKDGYEKAPGVDALQLLAEQTEKR